MTTLRKGDPSSPLVTQAALSVLTEAINSTNLEAPSGTQQAHHISKATANTLGIIAVVPIIVIPIAVTRGSSPSKTVTPLCSPGSATCG
jgi:hypothetical protein